MPCWEPESTITRPAGQSRPIPANSSAIRARSSGSPSVGPYCSSAPGGAVIWMSAKVSGAGKPPAKEITSGCSEASSMARTAEPCRRSVRLDSLGMGLPFVSRLLTYRQATAANLNLSTWLT